LVHWTFSSGLPALVKADGMGRCDPMEAPRHRSCTRWTHNQMPVCGHQAIGNESERVEGEAVTENGEKGTIISRMFKKNQTSGAAVNDVEVAGVLG